jgi:hypothetical protein
VKITDSYLRSEKDTWDSPFAGQIAAELLHLRRALREIARAVPWCKSECRCSKRMYIARAALSSKKSAKKKGKR